MGRWVSGTRSVHDRRCATAYQPSAGSASGRALILGAVMRLWRACRLTHRQWPRFLDDFSGSAVSGQRVSSDGVEDLDDAIDISFCEDRFGTGGGVIGVGRFVESRCVHNAVRGEFIDDQV